MSVRAKASRAAYLDCTFGITPAAVFGALAGIGGADVAASLRRVPAGRWKLRYQPVRQGAISALRPEFEFAGAEPRFHTPAGLEAALRRSKLPPQVLRRALEAYSRLAAVEARIHDVPASKVHFHEVGRAGSVLSLVGALLALDALEVGAVHASPLPFSDGVVQSEHGLLPIPAPATLELLKGVPMRPLEAAGEFVTPSGAALLRSLKPKFGPPPSWTVREVGYGAGRGPVLCRVVLGDLHA